MRQETKLGISVKLAGVQLLTSADDPYTWQVLLRYSAITLFTKRNV